MAAWRQAEVHGDRLRVGSPPLTPRPELVKWVPRASQLLSAGPEAFLASEPVRAAFLYWGSWALVSMLQADERYAPGFARYLEALAARRAPAQAWAEAFADHPVEELASELDREMGRWLEEARAPVRWLPLDPAVSSGASGTAGPGTEVVVRELTAAEAHLTWLALRAPTSPGFAHDLEHAERHAPDSPDVAVWRAAFLQVQGQREASIERLRAAVAARPDDAHFRTLLASMLLLSARRCDPEHGELAELARSLEADASGPRTLDFLARFRGCAGQPDAGMVFARRALEADSGCWRCRVTVGQLLLGKRDRAGAIAALRDALGMLPDHAPDVAEELRRTIDRLDGLGPAGPPPAPDPPGES